MRARRTDGNHKPLISQIRELPGVTVHSTHMVGDGFPDAVIGYKGRNCLIEIKDPKQPPSGRKLTPAEGKFFTTWEGQVNVVLDIEDVKQVINFR